MTPDESRDLRKWMEQRFDRIDQKVDERTSALAGELQATRHEMRPVLEQLAVQMAELVTTSRQHDRELGAINEWRSDEGPLDARLKRHSVRQDSFDGWRNRVVGALAVLTFLFPVTVGVIVAVLK